MNRKKLKLWGGIAIGVLVLGGIGQLMGPQDTEPKTGFTLPAPTVQPTEAAAPTRTAKPSPRAEQVATDLTGKALASKVEKAWLEEMGVDEPSELRTVLPGSLSGYVTKFEGLAVDTVEITVQVTSTEASKNELKRLATSVLSTAGYTIEELKRVEVVTADRLARGVENRRNVPLLNH